MWQMSEHSIVLIVLFGDKHAEIRRALLCHSIVACIQPSKSHDIQAPYNALHVFHRLITHKNIVI